MTLGQGRPQKLTYNRVATGYGQPPSTFYDWTLSQPDDGEDGFRLPPDAEGRLLIEKFSNKVTKALYSNPSDPVGLVKDNERSVLTRFLARDYELLEQTLQQYETSCAFAIIFVSVEACE